MMYGRAEMALWDDESRDEENDGGDRGDGRHLDPPLQVSPRQEPVTEWPADENTDGGTTPDDQHEKVGEDLVDVVLRMDEFDTEGLDAGQEVVAESAGDDEGDVRLDVEHVARPRR